MSGDPEETASPLLGAYAPQHQTSAWSAEAATVVRQRGATSNSSGALATIAGASILGTEADTATERPWWVFVVTIVARR